MADPQTQTQDVDESLCHFCGKVSRPWMTDDATWALVEPVLGQSQACLECFYDALPADTTMHGEPLVVALPESAAPGVPATPMPSALAARTGGAFPEGNDGGTGAAA